MIGYAKQTAPNRIEIYDPNGRYLGSCYCQPGGHLLGFTADTVSVQQTPTFVQIFNERGQLIGSHGG